MYSNNRSTTKTSNKKKIIVVIAGVLTLLLLVLFVLEATNTTNFFSGEADSSSTSKNEQTFDIPPTEEEKQSGDSVPIKQDPPNGDGDEFDNNSTEDNAGNDTSDSDATNVSVIISNAGVYDGKVEINAFTPDAIANGTCTYIFSSSTRNVTKVVQARADASSSICLDEPFPTSELSGSSNWNLEVTYQSSSGTYKGSKTTALAI